MTVAIMAKYPWEAVRPISGGEAPKVFILTDSRLESDGLALPQYQTVKQYVLAQNLVVCYASSHIFAMDAALRNKSHDPSTRGLNSQASERDVNRLGQMLLEQHDKLRGFSDVLAALWPKGSTVPNLYQLMHESYEPSEIEGVVGVGVESVLRRFQELLPDQLERQRLTPDDPRFDPELIGGLGMDPGAWSSMAVWEEVMQAVHVAFTDALLDTQDPAADIPITATLLDRDGIGDTSQSAVLTPTNQLLQITEFTKPSYYGAYAQAPQYMGGPRAAVPLFT